MTDVYKQCPVFENDNYLLRLINKNDEKDLSEVYSDKKALPFFKEPLNKSRPAD